jgi:Ca-activated chloride channel homolog
MVGFGHPQASYLFLALIALFFLFWFSQAKKKATLETFAQKELLPRLTSPIDRKRQRHKSIFVFMAFISGILALMRPQAGFYWEEGKRKGLDILFAVDTSRSMLTGDLKPNRLTFSKGAVREFVKTLKSDRVGLVAFSGEAFLVCPLTLDYNGFLQSLDSLDTDTLPQGGTSLSSAIQVALKSYRQKQGEKVLLLLSDGEDHEGDPIAAAQSAQGEGVKIFTFGMGTREGGLIPTDEGDRQKGFLKDRQGNVVKSSLNEEILKQIASGTGGSYVRAHDGKSGLEGLYGERLSKLEKGQFEGNFRKRSREWFQIPVALLILFSLLEFSLDARGNMTTRKLLTGLIFLIPFLFLEGCGNKGMDEVDRLYRDGRYDEAQRVYETLFVKDPDSYLHHYNLGAFLYKKGDPQGAIEHFTKTLLSDSLELEAKTNYNIGNSKFRLAEQAQKIDPGKAIPLYHESLDYYRRTLELNEKDEEARTNLGLVEKRLKYLQEALKSVKTKGQSPKERVTEKTKLPPAKGAPPSSEDQGPHRIDQRSVGQKERGENKKKTESPQILPSPSPLKDYIEMSREEAETLLERVQREEGFGAYSEIRKQRTSGIEMRKDW